MSPAYRCKTCHELPDWRIERSGDVAVIWAWDPHFALVWHRQQRVREKSVFTVTAALNKARLESLQSRLGLESDAEA
jgi:hypothetical protein